MQATYDASHFPGATFLKQEKWMSEHCFKMYLILHNRSKILFSYITNLKFNEIVHISFTLVFKIKCVFYTYSTTHFRLATFNCLMPHVASGYRIGQHSSGQIKGEEALAYQQLMKASCQMDWLCRAWKHRPIAEATNHVLLWSVEIFSTAFKERYANYHLLHY